MCGECIRGGGGGGVGVTQVKNNHMWMCEKHYSTTQFIALSRRPMSGTSIDAGSLDFEKYYQAWNKIKNNSKLNDK